MKLKIGSIFRFNDKIYKVIADTGLGCSDCPFVKYMCGQLQSVELIPSCARSRINDNKPIIFKEIKIENTVDLD